MNISLSNLAGLTWDGTNPKTPHPLGCDTPQQTETASLQHWLPEVWCFAWKCSPQNHFTRRKMRPQPPNGWCCQVLLQSFHAALWGSACCASCDCLFTFSQGKLAAVVCVWACQYKPKLQPTWICVSFHNKRFYSPHKKSYHTHTHLSSQTIKWRETYLHWISSGLLLPSSIQSLPASPRPT